MRYLALIVPIALLSGCIVRAPYYRTYTPVAAAAPAPAPVADVYYYGNHFIPEEAGGGWCYIDGPHTHDFYPDRDDYYEYDQGYYWYRGPFTFAFFGGHPLPAGGWCFLSGAHHHDYHPPRGTDWRWYRGSYVYEGQYRPNRPPPATYWREPARRRDWRVDRPAVRPAPPSARPRPDGRPAPGWRDRPEARPEPRPDDRPFPGGRPEPRDDDRRFPGARPDPRPEARDDAPFGRPEPRDDGRPGQREFAPGQGGNLPPGQGGVPPGQVRPESGPPPAVERRDEPDRGRGGLLPRRPDRDDRGGAAPGPSRAAPVERAREEVKERREDRKEKKEPKKEDDDEKEDRRRPGLRR